MTAGRRVFAGLAWLFVACIVVQFFLVGLRVFDVHPWTELHAEFAYLYGWLSPALVLMAGAIRVPHRTRRLALGLLCLFAIETFLPLLQPIAPWVAAVHAAFAFAVAWAAVALARAASSFPEGSGHRADDGGTTFPEDGGVGRSAVAEGVTVTTMRMLAAGAAWLFVAAVLLQVFLAGVGVFGAGSIDSHRELGWYIMGFALVQLVLQAVARTGGSTVGLAAVALFLTLLQPILAWSRLEAPLLAALHPANAFVIGMLGFVVARRATALARTTEADRLAEPSPMRG